MSIFDQYIFAQIQAKTGQIFFKTQQISIKTQHRFFSKLNFFGNASSQRFAYWVQSKVITSHIGVSKIKWTRYLKWVRLQQSACQTLSNNLSNRSGSTNTGFFYAFSGNLSSWNFRNLEFWATILEFSVKSLSFWKNPPALGGKCWVFATKINTKPQNLWIIPVNALF